MTIKKIPTVYILANKRNGTIYVGVTSNLAKRIDEHKNNLVQGFTSKYNCNKLVFFEVHNNMHSAISREKQLKGGSRAKKIKLIESMNSAWNDLYEQIH